MILYHGSNVEIDTIDLALCQVGKDFGCGFYLTDIKDQAESMAMRRTKITRRGSPIITSYLLDESELSGGVLSIKVLKFPTLQRTIF
jgi:hypothetical protein